MAPKPIRQTRAFLSSLPRSRPEARALGSHRYYTGKPCPKKHDTFRYTAGGQCYRCIQVKNRRHRERIYARIKENHKIVKAAIRKARSKPCTDCKHKFPWYVMEFDHRDGRNEDYRGFNNIRSLKRLQTELAKCDLVCANCHRARTYHRAVAAGRRSP